MSRSYWIAGIALGLVLYSSHAHAHVQQVESAGQSDEGDTAPDQIPIPLPVEIVENDAERDTRERQQREAIQLQMDDVAAQEAMNDASQRMADSASLQTWWVGAGTILLLITVMSGLAANLFAFRAVKTTRDIGQKQLRPWVCCEGYTVQHIANSKVIHDGKTFTEGIRFTLTWKNRGLSPAIACELRNHVQVVPTGEEAPEPDWGEAQGGDVIGPDGIRYGASAIFGDDHTAVLSQKCDVIVYGQLRYRDALDDTSRERVSEARYRLTVNGEQQNADGTRAPSWYGRCEGAQTAN